ncbi:MAG: butyrate kinase [Thermoguttaceae bacterium]
MKTDLRRRVKQAGKPSKSAGPVDRQGRGVKRSAASQRAKKRDLVIVINPGSTSTKLAVFRGETCIAGETINHPKEDLAHFTCVADQYEFRLEAVLKFLADHGIALDECLAVAGRGGLMKPIPGGVYAVNGRMLKDLRSAQWGEHPSNLGAPIALELSKRCNAPAFIADPVTSDEFWVFSRYAGHRAFERKSRLHALSQRAAARRAARELGVSYEKANFVVVHMGGGISIGAHRKGRVVDANDALDGDGPFSPERSGSVPTGMLAKACFSDGKTYADIWKMLVGQGGIYSYLGTNDCREVEERMAKGDAKAAEVYEAMAYQIAKWIGASAAVLSGQVKAVVVTGGMARSKPLIRFIRKYAGFVAPFVVYPEVEEMTALASAAQAAMARKIKIQEYR